MPIDRSKSLLMTDELTGSFDRVEEQCLRVKQGLPQLWARDKMQEIADRIARLKEQMERPRYYVGFLGRSQVGKSSTLNSILRASPNEGPGTGGAGAPMTSNITRLFRIDPDSSTDHQLVLRFMTRAQFQRRRDDLCRYLGFRPEDTDDAILSQLANLLALTEDPGEASADAPKPTAEKNEDRRYLARLLRSYQRYPNLVADPPRVEPGDYSKRKEYTNHPTGNEPWPYLLLSQVEVGYRTQAISPKIELIDLPGLGARLFSDDLLTETFLPQLDGALVFQSSEQVAAKEAYDLLSKLNGQFRRMEGRVWMIFTKFDGLTPDHHGSTSETTNILDNIAKTLGDNKVPHEQVLLVGNVYHAKLLGQDGRVRSPSAELVDSMLHLKLDDEGQPIIPAGFQRHSILTAAYKEFLRDGGMERVRRVIGEELATLVEEEVREQVGSELRRIRSTLAGLVRSAAEASRMDANGFRKAILWKVQLQQAQQGLVRDRAILERPTRLVMDQLNHEFINHLCPPALTLPGLRLVRAHADYSRVLREKASVLCRNELTPAVYGWITEKIQTAEHSMGAVRLDGHTSVLQAWEECKERDMGDPSWLNPLIDFDNPPLFPQPVAGEPAYDVQFRDTDYREAIARKVQTVCHRVALATSHRVGSHLNRMIDGLGMLQEAESHLDSAPSAIYQEILQALA